MRLFIAINFPAEIKAAITKIRDRIKESSFRGNFTLDDNLHLTLVFLGECDNRQSDAIRTVMDETIFSEFTLTFDKVGYFKRSGGNIWWAGLHDNNPLSALQADLIRRLSQKGFVLENRKYTPHVTIGREVKTCAGLVLREIPPVSFSVKSIELMKSERLHGKLVYMPIYSKQHLTQIPKYINH